jgi:DNA-binding SARP family transcriptional activator
MIRATPKIHRGPFAEALASPSGSLLALLGRPSLLAGARLAPLKLRPKAVAVIAYLALEDREVQRRDLARLLFPDAEAPLATLRWHLAHVRSSAPSFITRHLSATRETVSLTIPTDVTLFRINAQLICRQPGMPGACGALAMYRDDLIAGLAVSATAEFDNWLYVAQEGLRRDFRMASLAFAGWALDHRAERQAIEPLTRLITIDPYVEEGHVLLIEVYEALGETARATAAYDRYQRIVRHELAAEPRPALVLRFEGQTSTGSALPREDFVSLKDVTLHILDWAGGEPTIVAIHGSAGSGTTSRRWRSGSLPVSG